LRVLPLTTTAGDPSLEALRTGFAEELAGRLRLTGLQVSGPGSGPGTADVVLSGSIERSLTSVRVAMRLDDARDKRRLWSGSFDSRPDDASLLTGVVAAQLASVLGVGAGPAANPGGHRFEAWEACLKGRYHWGRRTVPDFEKAVEYFRRAIAIEPGYADAHAGLAMALGFLDRRAEARRAARTALALDPGLADVRAFLALSLLHHDFHPELARREFERAAVLAPNSALVHHWYAFYFSYTGQHAEAIREIRRAERLDPLSLVIGTDAGVILLQAGRPEEAAAELREVLDLDPTYWNAHYYLALTLETLGRNEEALAEWRKREMGPIRAVPTLVALGRAGEARAIVTSELAKPDEARPDPVAMTHALAALGDRELAFEWIERAFQQRRAELMTILVNHRFDPLRDDPRYAELLVRMNLRG
jgi:tetratricopeptide (TPR) repeat protein